MSSFTNQDLVLTVSSDYDPNLLQLDQYEGFIDALCGDREYQKEAIRTVCRFLGGGQLPTVRLQSLLLQPHVRWWDAAATVIYLSYFIVPFALAGVLWVQDRERWLAFRRRMIAVRRSTPARDSRV